MELKIAFADGNYNVIRVADYYDIKNVKESIERKEKWTEIDGFFINLDNVAYIKMEDD